MLDDFASWPVQAGMRTLAFWKKNPGVETTGWSPDAVDIKDCNTYIDPRKKLRFELVSWNPVRETEEAYKKRVIAKVSRYLDRTLRKYFSPRPPDHHEKSHYAWLVEYQINGLSYSKIAKKESMDRNTITPAIRNLAKLLFAEQWRWWLRPQDVGGRPKSKTS